MRFMSMSYRFGRRGVRGEAEAEGSLPEAGRRGRHRHGGGRHHRQGGRGERVFDHGDLRLVIMALLAERPRYGYEIIKALEERVGGGYSPSPGVVYPNLTLLEEVGHATVSEDRGRRLYTLSGEGQAWLAASRPAADAILSRIDESAAMRAGPPAKVARALDNLEASVRLRLRGRPVSEAQVRAIADTIDAAARAIEDV